MGSKDRSRGTSLGLVSVQIRAPAERVEVVGYAGKIIVRKRHKFVL